ncbi:hypothetical protein QE152_g14266 [Popillia japonica]|uniref:Uncharacterized protein n=1 Tax=Popillia japonica TaxID=7064 RepID=A0AAW1L8P2_POPJA
MQRENAVLNQLPKETEAVFWKKTKKITLVNFQCDEISKKTKKITLVNFQCDEISVRIDIIIKYLKLWIKTLLRLGIHVQKTVENMARTVLAATLGSYLM